MNYHELAVEFLTLTHPKGKRPPFSRVQKMERAKDMIPRYLMDHDGVATPGELAEVFDVSSARITKILGDLEEQGLVTRKGNRHDRRRVIVCLTPVGEKWVLRKQERKELEFARLLQALGEEDAQAMVRLTRRIVEIIESGEAGFTYPHR